jgi:hypothetical protein
MTNKVFVFGSNLQGIHGAGAAREAWKNHGAVTGEGQGLHGNSYAIPTKATPWRPLGLGTVEMYIEQFIAFAHEHPELYFTVTKVGCGLAGFKEEEIAPLFKGAPKNCHLPIGWER